MPPEDMTESAESAVETVLDRAKESSRATWQNWASLTTMLLALLSAVGGLMAGTAGNEAMIKKQQQVADQVDRNQAQLRLEILLTRIFLMESSGHGVDQKIRDEAAHLASQLESFYKRTAREETDSVVSLRAHEWFAFGTTLLSAAITVIGMSIIIERKPLWIVGIAIGACGTGAILYGFTVM